MSGNFEAREQEQTSKAIDGIAYGRNVRVLARTGERLLIWVPGQSVWSGTGQPWRYEASGMFIHQLDRGHYRRLCSGGRLASQLRDQAAEIDRAFGEGFHKLLDPKKTIVVGA